MTEERLYTLRVEFTDGTKIEQNVPKTRAESVKIANDIVDTSMMAGKSVDRFVYTVHPKE